jgi:Signal transduction histidine kinase
MQEVLIIVLFIVIIILLGLLIILKKNIRDVKKELKKTIDEDYNRQLRVTLLDKDVEALATEINRNLEYQKALKLETENSRRQLEQSISDIAHDLRTPLTVVKGNLQMLESEDLSPKGREYLGISRRKAESLKGMVDEFFELSVLESDSKPVEMEKVDITAFLTEFVVENETLIRSHNLAPEITFPEKSIFVQANRAILSRVFSNLMGNILKYAKEGFELGIYEETLSDSGKNEKKVCRIRVGNNVDDPSTIDIDHIFDRTYRADKARSDGSAGLGLYIARLLTTKQKGSITACLENGKLYFDIILNKC